MLDSMLESLKSIDWPEGEQVVRVAAALILGGLIGLEREFRDKPAGFRTIILICVGACVFTMISQTIGGPDWDSTRIAAQIVSGIGFLGAGAILRDRVSVFGLTTAATIWSVAAIGMAAGFGQLSLAILGTVAILAALYLLDAVEHWIGQRRDIQRFLIVVANEPGVLARIDALFADANLRTRKRTWYEDGEELVFQIHAMGNKANHEQLRMKLAHSPDYRLRRS